MINIFISYSEEDAAEVTRLWEQLNSYPGVDVWFDKKSLLPGDAWEYKIRKAMLDADYVLVMLSSKSVKKKGYFQREVRTAIEILDNDVPENATFIIPVRLEKCDIHFERLAHHQRVDMFPSWEGGVEQLCKLIEAHRRAEIGTDQSVRLCAHQASFVSALEVYYFVTITNMREIPIEITHVWFEDVENHIPINARNRNLPKRLESQEIWETFLPKNDIPEYLRDDAYECFRIRISTGAVYTSTKDDTVPPYGVVPG